MRARSSASSGESTHPLGGLADPGVGPRLIGADRRGLVGVVLGDDRDQVVAHQAGVLGGHEVHVAGPCGADGRLAERHRLEQVEPQALRAVQRHVDVARRAEGQDLLVRHRAVDDRDARVAGEQLADARGGIVGPRERGRVVELDDEPHVGRVVARRKRLLERLERGDRVLARQVARDVEAQVEQHGLLGQFEARAVGLDVVGEEHRLRVVPHGRGRRRGAYGVGDEARGREHHVDGLEQLDPAPLHRQPRQLPERHAGVETVGEREPGRRVLRHVGDIGGVDLEEVDAVLGLRGLAHVTGVGGVVPAASAARVDVDRFERLVTAREREQRVARRDGKPEVAGHVPDEVDAG